jgi:hypothetical protein
MIKFSLFLKKLPFVLLILAVGFTFIPVITASAASLQDQTILSTAPPDNNSPLQYRWAQVQIHYLHQDERLTRASHIITRVQTLIDRAKEKGLDTSALQVALDAFTTAIPKVQTIHDR